MEAGRKGGRNSSFGVSLILLGCACRVLGGASCGIGGSNSQRAASLLLGRCVSSGYLSVDIGLFLALRGRGTSPCKYDRAHPPAGAVCWAKCAGEGIEAPRRDRVVFGRAAMDGEDRPRKMRHAIAVARHHELDWEGPLLPVPVSPLLLRLRGAGTHDGKRKKKKKIQEKLAAKEASMSARQAAIERAKRAKEKEAFRARMARRREERHRMEQEDKESSEKTKYSPNSPMGQELTRNNNDNNIHVLLGAVSCSISLRQISPCLVFSSDYPNTYNTAH